MIIKGMDPKKEEKEQLRELLKGQLSEKQRFLIERQLRNIEAGERGEKDSAYFIDFYFGKSKNWAVVHDLRIQHEGQVAQIDHLVMNRFMDIYVLETKNFYYGLKVTPEGEFLIYNGQKYIGIESPLEQNERHIFLLTKAIEHHGIMPTRLGVVIQPRFVSYVLVSPSSRIIRPSRSRFDTSRVMQSDQAFTKIKKDADDAGAPAILKICSSETLEATAKKLARFHRRTTPDFKARFGINDRTEYVKQPDRIPIVNTGHGPSIVCEACASHVSEKIVQYCLDRKHLFKGRILCYTCQRVAPTVL
jgi:hypothetical protein